MEALEEFLAGPLVRQFGWMLVHFIWQGLAVAFLLGVLLRILRRHNANTRYVVACCAMFLLAALPVLTLVKGSVPTAWRTPQAAQNPAAVFEQPRNFESTTSTVSTPPPPSVQNPSRPVSAPSTGVTPRVLVWNDISGLIEPYLPVAVLIWLLGVFALSIWRMGGWVELQRFKKRHVKPLCDDLSERIKILIRKVGVSRPVRVVESAIVQIPSTIGWLKPVILVPTSAITGLPPKQLEAILAHELAHIRRHDYLINLLQAAVETLFFYHPAVWWVSRQIRNEREHCCDEIAVAVCGDAYSYACALTKLEESRHTPAQLAVAASGGHLSNRIRHVLNFRYGRSRRSGAWAAGPAIIVTAVFLCFLALAGAVQDDSIFPLRGPGGEFHLGHGRILTVTFSPDGKFFATGSYTGIYLWDYETGKIIRSFVSPEEGSVVGPLSFSSDGTKILVNKYRLVSGPASVWDVASGERLCTIDPVHSAAFSPDGTQIAAVSWGGYLRLCDSETGEVIRNIQLQKGAVGGIAYSPDGDKVLITSTECTIIWDPSTGGVLRVDERVLPDDYYEGTQYSSMEGLAVSHDGKQYVVFEYAGAFKWEMTAILRDIQTGEIVRTYGPCDGCPWQTSFSPDDSKVLMVSNFLLQIWDLETNTVDTVDSLYDYNVASAVFSPDGESILARISRFPYDSWLAAILDLSSGEILKKYRHNTAIALAFRPEENRILTAGREAAVYEWDARTGELLHAYNDFGNLTGGFRSSTFSPEAFKSVCFSPDGTKILAVVADPDYNGPGHVALFEIQTGFVIRKYGISYDENISVAFSSDGSRYLIAPGEGVPTVWNTDTGERLFTCEPCEFSSPRIIKTSFSEDGTKILGTIVELQMDGTTDPASEACGGVIWDAETGTILFSKLSNPTWSISAYSNISISPSSPKVAFGPGLYDLKTGDLIKQFRGNYIVFSPEEPILASVSVSASHTPQIDLWDTSTLQPIRTIEFEEQTDQLDPMEIPNITFSPDGSILAVITQFSGRLWSVRTGEELGNLGPYAALQNASDRTVAFSPDATKLIEMGDGYEYPLCVSRMWDISQFATGTFVEDYLLHNR